MEACMESFFKIGDYDLKKCAFLFDDFPILMIQNMQSDRYSPCKHVLCVELLTKKQKLQNHGKKLKSFNFWKFFWGATLLISCMEPYPGHFLKFGNYDIYLMIFPILIFKNRQNHRFQSCKHILSDELLTKKNFFLYMYIINQSSGAPFGTFF